MSLSRLHERINKQPLQTNERSYNLHRRIKETFVSLGYVMSLI